MFLRKLGKFLRGNASAANIILATTLGAILAWLPSLSAAPGLYLLLFLLALIFNANLFLLALSFFGFVLLSLFLAPVTFQIGFILLEGPLQGLFRFLINAPVTAWFGLEYYLTTGGLFVGLLLGVLLGLFLSSLLSKFRRTMAALETGSPRYQALAKNFWFKSVAFILFGGLKGKKSFSDMMEQGSRGPLFRRAGLIAAAGMIVVIVVASLFLNERILTEVVRTQLERFNRATVDLEAFRLDAAAGKVEIDGLAFANAAELQRNLFSAEKLEAEIGLAQLLSKRFVVSQLLIDGARSGEMRRLPGQPVGPTLKEPATDDTTIESEPAPTDDTETTVRGLLDAYPVWKERLSRLRHWMETAQNAKQSKAERAPSLRDRLREQARQLGYGELRADHLITGRPTFTLENLEIRQLQLEQLPGETLHLKGTSLATHPHLLPDGPGLSIEAESGKLSFSFAGDGLAAGSTPNRVSFTYLDLPVQTVRKMAGEAANRIPIREGLIDIATSESTIDATELDLNLEVVIRDALVSIRDTNEFRISSISLPTRIHGPIDQPRVGIDSSSLQSALGSALQEKARDFVEDKLKEEIGDRIDTEELKKRLPRGLDSLF